MIVVGAFQLSYSILDISTFLDKIYVYFTIYNILLKSQIL